MKNHTALYLKSHATSEAHTFERPPGAYRYVMVIPAFDENQNFLENILRHDAHDLLVILVVNLPVGLDRMNPAIQRTRALLSLGGIWDRSRNIYISIVDRVSEPIPAHQGVGLARKIGADIALRLISTGQVEKNVIYSTDADVTLPAGYFQAPSGSAAAWIFPYTHKSANSSVAHLGLLYELSMRYYVDRLEYARSPYAYHALGSCLAINAVSYAKVRGFPPRNAAEDFYLLNKIAKIGEIHRLQNPVIEIEARLSTRVPFGTGPALAKIPGDEASYQAYAPAIFDALKSLHQEVERGNEVFSDPIPHLLEAIGYAKFTSTGHGQREFHTWFDAFKTLKFVREARHMFPDKPLLETLYTRFPNTSNTTQMNAILRQNEGRMPRVKGIASVTIV